MSCQRNLEMLFAPCDDLALTISELILCAYCNQDPDRKETKRRRSRPSLMCTLTPSSISERLLLAIPTTVSSASVRWLGLDNASSDRDRKQISARHFTTSRARMSSQSSKKLGETSHFWTDHGCFRNVCLLLACYTSAEGKYYRNAALRI